MAAPVFRVDDILQKMAQRDPDFRFMAVSDLFNECNKDTFKLDAAAEKKICAKLLEMVTNDVSVEVKTLCVKCLAPLSAKITEPELTTLITGLRSNVLGLNKVTPETMDISSLALKFIIGAVSDATKTLIIPLLVPTLTTEIGKSKQQEVVWYSLDVVNDLLARWGKEMTQDSQKLKDATLPHLTSDNLRARKKAIGCLGYLAVSLPQDLLNSLVEHLISQTQSSKKLEHSRTFLATLATVSRAVGGRLASFVPKIVPLLFKFADAREGQEEENDEDVKDNCFQCLESLLLRCPKDTDKQFEEIEKLCIKYLSWDPLIIGFEDDEASGADMDEDDDFGGLVDDEQDAYADDDLSWKVRKAATRCISAIIKTRPEKLSHLYELVVPTLIKRFKEREENVKLDVMNAVGDVLRQTLNVASVDGHHHSLVKKLATLVPDIIKGLVKELTGKSAKAKIGAFNLLTELTTVVPDALDSHVASFVPGITGALEDKAPSNLKIEALCFLKSCMSHKSASAVFLPHIEGISKPVLKSVSDPYYKITAEALRVCSQIIKILASSETFDPTPHVGPFFNAISAKLESLGVDQEVKEGAIESSGLLLSLLGHKLTEDQIQAILKILVERISNEVTFLSTVQTIDLIAGSKHKIEFGAHLSTIMKELSGYLRKKNRQVKQASLTALISVVKAHGKNKNAISAYDTILKELAPLVSEQDLHLAHLALRLTYTILHASSSTADSIQSTVLPSCHELLKNSLLQGAALESMQKLFQELVKAKSKKVSYEVLLKGLTGLTGDLSKQSYNSIAQCIAVLVAGNDSRDDAIKKFVADSVSKKESERLLALYCVGEIGTRIDLTSFANVKTNILASLDHSSEDVKSAASVAFGCVACGNMNKFLPEILSEVQSHPTRKYLLLASLREVIVRLSGSKEGKENLTKHFEEVLKLLFEHADHTEEGTRNMISECLGKMALIQPETVVTQLKERTKNPSSKVRAAVVTALKYTIFEKSLPIDKVLKEHITAFLDLITDKEIEVRKATLISLNYIAHHKAKIVSKALPKYLGHLYGETKIKPELIVEIVLGPFKHKQDNGLEIRQAAFECMYTLLDTCLTKLEIQEYVSHLASGLCDEYDVQMLCHLILVRLSKKAPTALVSGLDQLVEPLRLCVTGKAKDEAVVQQVERNNELIRSALRAIHAINKVADIETVPKYQEFMKLTVLQGDLAKIYAELATAS